MPTPELLNSLSNISVVGLLFFILWSGLKQWWVWGWLYQQSEKEKNEWKNLALRTTGLAEHIVKGKDS